MRNKRGWIHILEATIAVMIVAGVMVAVYSSQPEREEFAVSDFAGSLQSEILDKITVNSEMRLKALQVENENYDDANYMALDLAIAEEVPVAFDHLLRICELNATSCKMSPEFFTATLDRDVYVEESVISSEIFSEDEFVYDPIKLRLFLWKGEINLDGCPLNCTVAPDTCSLDDSKVIYGSCVDPDGDGCFELQSTTEDCAVSEGYGCSDDSVSCECIPECSIGDPDDTSCSGLYSVSTTSCVSSGPDGLCSKPETSISGCGSACPDPGIFYEVRGDNSWSGNSQCMKVRYPNRDTRCNAASDNCDTSPSGCGGNDVGPVGFCGECQMFADDICDSSSGCINATTGSACSIGTCDGSGNCVPTSCSVEDECTEDTPIVCEDGFNRYRPCVSGCLGGEILVSACGGCFDEPMIWTNEIDSSKICNAAGSTGSANNGDTLPTVYDNIYDPHGGWADYKCQSGDWVVIDSQCTSF